MTRQFLEFAYVTQEHKAQRAAAVIHADDAQSNICVCTVHTRADRFLKYLLNPIPDASFSQQDMKKFIKPQTVLLLKIQYIKDLEMLIPVT